MHYNTTNETGQLLMLFTEKTRSQEDIIYEIFKSMPQKSFTWSEISEKLPHINEVSLKRAITDLKNANLLEKTSEKALTKYGRPAYKYKIHC